MKKTSFLNLRSLSVCYAFVKPLDIRLLKHSQISGVPLPLPLSYYHHFGLVFVPARGTTRGDGDEGEDFKAWYFHASDINFTLTSIKDNQIQNFKKSSFISRLMTVGAKIDS